MDGLYRTPRTYFDSGSDEFKNHPIKEKLLDIGYATWFGHNIRNDINHIIRRYPHVSNRDIRRAIWMMMAELCHIDDFNVFDKRNTIDMDIDLFLEYLMRVFRLPEGDRRKAYIGSGPRSIEFSELNAMNGWKEAAGHRTPYKMYSVGNWVMFPGDEEIIRRFNLDGSTADRCYPSFVYPEPWYGNPVRAKVVVLGNEARYDDFVSRIQNLVLQKGPGSHIESVEVTVHAWHELDGPGFYEPCYSGINDFRSPEDFFEELALMDRYNSPTYRFWLTEFRKLGEVMNVESSSEFFYNVAVINANPYPSVGVEPLEAGRLPSHYFLRQLVRFITNNNPSVLFILPSESLHFVWRKILADVYTDLMAFGRMMVLGKGKSIHLARNATKTQIKELRSILAK